MVAVNEWWTVLTPVNQGFYVAACFFGVIFLWQLVAALAGLGSDVAVDSHVGSVDAHATPGDAQDSVMSFQLVSVRSILAFATLFTWAGALYMNVGFPTTRALLLALLWGVAAMALVSVLLHYMKRLSETGNIRLSSAVGSIGTVHLDIPADGQGEVRAMCSGVVTHLKARSRNRRALKAGLQVRIVGMVESGTAEVEGLDDVTEKKES